ncbi:ribosome-binding protein 1b isoform X1 [Gadus macrocephalus]|uniref:ribosome-binding protein 1b isoform X1 n=1 Tax=Gadus macrocephalus TaxID=80720 RepID=UPI0028CB2149|nr:ribosome-binding protein 1b isoform X1 [Gadus macrocephalus]
MDAWDPQTLALLVFGGFMVVSAVGMALVSLVSMRETSYEDALDQQRRQNNRTQPQRSDRRKKEKPVDKRKTKRREVPEPDALEPAVASTSEPESDPEPASEPAASPPAAGPGLPVVPELVEEAPIAPEAPPPTSVEAPPPTSVEAPPPAASPKEKRKKKKSGKLEPISPAETLAKETVVVASEVVVVATETLSMGSVPSDPAPAPRDPASATGEEPKMDTPTKKKKAKAEPETDPAGPLPYKTLMSSVTEATLSQKEVQKLIQALQQKSPQTSGEADVVAALKKKLEEKEKQLNNEKKDATITKTRLRDLTKEVGAERTKMQALEAGLRAELLASDHAKATLTQQLQLKVSTLQEQLENGPSGQLTRLTQENSILRDALNQATSQAESRQNAELARLRQEVLRGAREVTELSRRNEALQGSEERRRSLENKLSSVEQQLAQNQLTHVAKERGHQQRQEEMQEELRRCSDVIASLQERLTQAQQHEVTIAELRGSLGSAQEELQVLKACPPPQVDDSSKMEELNTRLQEKDQQVTSLEEEVQNLKKSLETSTSNGMKSEEKTTDSQTQEDTRMTEMEAVLEERERRVVTLETDLDKLKEEMETLRSKVQDSGSETESEQPFESLEKDSQMLALEEELVATREDLVQTKHKNNELEEQSRTAVEALSAAETMNLQRLTEAQQALVVAEDSASHLQTEVQKCLHVLFPEVSVELQQGNWLELITQKALETQQDTKTSQDVLTKLQEKEKECEMNRNVGAQAEGELLSVQSRAEEQERIWTHRLALADQQRQEALERVTALEESLELVNSGSANKQLREQLMLLEAQLEKQLESSYITETSTQEVAEFQSFPSESDRQLEIAQTEVQTEELTTEEQEEVEVKEVEKQEELEVQEVEKQEEVEEEEQEEEKQEEEATQELEQISSQTPVEQLLTEEQAGHSNDGTSV